MALLNLTRPTGAKCATRCASVALTVLAGLGGVNAGAQVASCPGPWGGDGDYNDLWQPSAQPHGTDFYNKLPSTDPDVTAVRWATEPLGLSLSFDVDASHVLVEWKRPKHLGRPLPVTNYQLRMKKANARAWGRWLEIGPIEAKNQSIVIHSVEPGVTYEIEVRGRNHLVPGRPASGTVTIPSSPAPS